MLFVTDGGKGYPLGGLKRGSLLEVAQRWSQNSAWITGSTWSKAAGGCLTNVFPRSGGGLENVCALLWFYAVYYSHIKLHQFLKQNTAIPSRKGAFIQRL